MSWIKIKNGLITNKKIARLAGKMKWGKLQTVGFLVSFWIWAIENCEDGQLKDIQDGEIAFAVGLENADGILDALVHAGLVDLDPCRIHDWIEHQHEFLRGKYKEKPEEYRKILEFYRSNTGVTPEQSGLERKKERKIDIIDKEKEGKVAVAPFVLPDWIDKDTWKDFCDMRVKIRKPLTVAAMKLTISELAKLQDKGYNSKGVLEQSIQKSWQGVFAPNSSFARPAVISDVDIERKLKREYEAEQARLNAKP